MHGPLGIREDHGLARDHVPGDPVDEGFPFAAFHVGIVRQRPMGEQFRLIAVGPGYTPSVPYLGKAHRRRGVPIEPAAPAPTSERARV